MALLGLVSGCGGCDEDVARGMRSDAAVPSDVDGVGPPTAGAPAAVGSCDELVCTEVPPFVAALGGQACCREGECGVRIPNNPTIVDVCIPLRSPGEPSFDCMTAFDTTLFAYRYGCCLPIGLCGEETLLGVEPFGCVDIRIAGFPHGGTCDPTRSCKRHESPCADASECCPLSAEGVLCADFDSAGAMCAMHCQQDSDCHSNCCRQTKTGERACAPIDACP